MVILEVEQKFNWTTARYHALQKYAASCSKPRLKLDNLTFQKFRDTYYDKNNKLCSNGLWIRKRQPHSGPFKWEAKQMKQRSSFARAAYIETKGPSRILDMVREHICQCPDSTQNFGLDVFCDFETSRHSFVANDKFNVVLDETDFGHQVGEVEMMAEDAERAHGEIEGFMGVHSWFFDRSCEPRGKLTAFFEEVGYPGAADA